jgi:nicotinate-nucleotide pyrophosphorylase (carboxylating)
VQHLSGIATMTRAYVDAMAGTSCTLLDTRKTIPGLRVLEKYATRMGGATNHRMGLWDAAMIKDNHVRGRRRGEAVRRARKRRVSNGSFCEVDRIEPDRTRAGRRGDHLLLDNMDVPTCCARPWRWLPAACRLKHRRRHGWIRSAPRRKPASPISRSVG